MKTEGISLMLLLILLSGAVSVLHSIPAPYLSLIQHYRSTMLKIEYMQLKGQQAAP
jgi:hypothetical protein